MHTKPMKQSDGVSSEWKDSETGNPCRSCGAKTVQYRIWESSCGGYEDVNLRCTNCGREWWVEGDDG